MRLKFTHDDAARAYREWGANCGPGAIAAVLGLSLDELRPWMGDFERKRYTNPTLMWEILKSLGIRWQTVKPPHPGAPAWPIYGLARVQWEGPWTEPGVPIAARYRHTHWVGARRRDGIVQIFDINAMTVGGWIDDRTWRTDLVPWLIRECVPRANGKWHLTHSLEVDIAGQGD